MSVSYVPAVVKDTIYTLRSDFTPIECFLRIQSDGVHEGSGWFQFEDGLVSAETWNRRGGKRRHELSVDGRVHGFNAHPVVTDALLCAGYQRSGTLRRQRIRNVFASSEDPFGRTGPSLVTKDIEIEWFGKERLQTVAGEIETDHYGLYARPDDSEPLQELWCLADTLVLIQGCAAGVYQTQYQLSEWSVS